MLTEVWPTKGKQLTASTLMVWFPHGTQLPIGYTNIGQKPANCRVRARAQAIRHGVTIIYGIDFARIYSSPMSRNSSSQEEPHRALCNRNPTSITAEPQLTGTLVVHMLGFKCTSV